MPLRNRAYGLAATTVVPTAWASDHRPVIEKTLTGSCRILPPTKPGQVTVAADLTHTTPNVEPDHTGPFRLQVSNAQAATAILGDQAQTTAVYLVVVTADAEPAFGSTVVVDACPDDPTAVGRRFTIRKVTHGSQVWERDLWCVDDLTAPTS